MKRTFLALTALAVLAACSDDAPDPAPSPTATIEANAPPVATLTAEDIEGAALAGELSCSFVQDGGTDPVLVASADVLDEAHAEGVVKLGPSTVRLKAPDAGGFNAMVKRARFTGGDLIVAVTTTSDAPRGGGEAPPLPAVLEMGAAGLEPQRISGGWACGP